MNIEELKRLKQDAEMAKKSLDLLTGHHGHLLTEFDRVTKQRDELLAALKDAKWAISQVGLQDSYIDFDGVSKARTHVDAAIAKVGG